MNPIDIVLIVAGILVIIISCVLVDRSQTAQKQMLGKSIASIEETLTQEDRKQLLKQVEALLAQVQEEAILRTDHALSKLSNEKIMAVSDFSDQLLEKIRQNHEEVVFLYNMLNDKEKELKSIVSEHLKTTAEAKPQLSEKEAVQTQAAGGGQGEKAPAAVVQELQELSQTEGMVSNNNTQILELYSRGKSIVEISRILDLGQGEVKLVIDLFKGKK